MADYRDFYRELRTDWLKLRGCLFDSNTRLPSLPMVLDGVRRRLEAGERVGLIYVDPSGGGHLEAIHGWQAYDRLVREVAEGLRQSRLGSSDDGVLAVVGVRGDEFVMFTRLASVDRLEPLRQAVAEEVGSFLEERPESSFRVTPQTAAVELEIQPDVRIERSLYQGLHRARELCRQEQQRRRSDRLNELDRILGERDVVVRYQPIVDLASGRIHGFEALSMAPSESLFETPDMLFSFAEDTGRILDLDRVCRLEAMDRARPLLTAGADATGSKIFLNCSAQVFHDTSLLADLLDAVKTPPLGPETVVLEVTERVAITEWEIFRESLGCLRQAGIQVAIDDMGSGYSSLQAVAEIEPDYLKFDLTLVSGIHASPIKREMLATLVTLARRIGAKPIAEGIEEREELAAVQLLGVDYGQGFLFARPALPAEAGHVHFPEIIAG